MEVKCYSLIVSYGFICTYAVNANHTNSFDITGISTVLFLIHFLKNYFIPLIVNFLKIRNRAKIF